MPVGISGYSSKWFLVYSLPIAALQNMPVANLYFLIVSMGLESRHFLIGVIWSLTVYRSARVSVILRLECGRGCCHGHSYSYYQGSVTHGWDDYGLQSLWGCFLPFLAASCRVDVSVGQLTAWD